MAKVIQYKAILFFFGLSVVLNMQAQFSIRYKNIPRETIAVRNVAPDSLFADAIAAKTYIAELPRLLARKGFLTATIDTVIFEENSAEVYIFLGKKYKWSKLLIAGGDAEDSVLFASVTQNFSSDISAPLDRTILKYLSKGYAFVTVTITDVELKEDQAFGSLVIEKGSKILIDSIHIAGKKLLTPKFLRSYLQIEKGTVYSDALPALIDKKINRLKFVETSKATEYRFLQTSGFLNLYLKANRVNQASAIIGFMSRSGAKPVLTGNAHLLLHNSLGNGEEIFFNWQQLLPRSQNLKLHFDQPYFFTRKLGIRTSFELFKKDSGFVSVNFQLGATHAVNERAKLLIYLRRFSSFLNTVDTIKIKTTKQLPSEADMSTVNVGVHHTIEYRKTTEDRMEGWFFNAEAEAESRTLKMNNTVLSIKSSNFDFRSLYDTVKRNTLNVRLKATAEKYFTFGPSAYLKSRIHTATFLSKKKYANELYRIGGLQTLRGFDEESIFVSDYIIGSAEYRYVLNNGSYFSVFSDHALLSEAKYLYSLGCGVNINSSSGTLQVVYALGKQNDRPWNFRAGKIHLGFVASF